MDDAALVRMCEAGTDLLQVEERAIEAEFLFATILRHVAAAEIFQHQIMKRGAIEIERGAVTEAADDVGMTDPIEGNCFILKILDESLFEISILITLKQHIQSFDDDFAELLVGRRQIARHVDFGIAAATETIFDVIASINPALEKFQFGH